MALTMYMNGHGYDAHLGADSIGGQLKASPAVKDMQVLLQAVAKVTGNPNFGVTSADGVVGYSTTFALLNIVQKGAAKIPVISQVISAIQKIPYGGDILRAVTGSRKAFRIAINVAEVAYPDKVRDIYMMIQNSAEQISAPLRLLASAVPQAPSGSPPIDSRFVVGQLQPAPSIQQPFRTGTVVTAEGGAAKFFKSPLTWAILGGAAVVGTAAYIVLRK